jgi:hypothetical protein
LKAEPVTSGDSEKGEGAAGRVREIGLKEKDWKCPRGKIEKKEERWRNGRKT